MVVPWSSKSVDATILRNKFLNGEFHPTAKPADILAAVPGWNGKYNATSFRAGVSRVKTDVKKIQDQTGNTDGKVDC
jgi:hypothetical protein